MFVSIYCCLVKILGGICSCLLIFWRCLDEINNLLIGPCLDMFGDICRCVVMFIGVW